MATALVFVAFFASVFGVFYLYFTTRNRERMSMIDKGVDASQLTVQRQPVAKRQGTSFRFSLKAGCLIVGTGIGFIVSYILFVSMFPSGTHDYRIQDTMFPLMVVGIVFLFGGLGLVTGYFLGRKMDKADFKD